MDLREVQRPLLTWLLSFVRFKRQSFLEGAGPTLVLPYVISALGGVAGVTKQAFFGSLLMTRPREPETGYPTT